MRVEAPFFFVESIPICKRIFLVKGSLGTRLVI